MTCHAIALPGMAWHDMAWHGITHHGMAVQSDSRIWYAMQQCNGIKCNENDPLSFFFNKRKNENADEQQSKANATGWNVMEWNGMARDQMLFNEITWHGMT